MLLMYEKVGMCMPASLVYHWRVGPAATADTAIDMLQTQVSRRCQTRRRIE